MFCLLFVSVVNILERCSRTELNYLKTVLARFCFQDFFLERSELCSVFDLSLSQRILDGWNIEGS